MSPPRLLAILLVLIPMTPGCADQPEDLPKLDMVINDRGLISYFPAQDGTSSPDEEAPSSVSARSQPRVVEPGRRADEDAYQEMVRFRKERQDRMTAELKERMEEQARHDQALKSQRERDRMEEQEGMRRRHEEFARNRAERDREVREREAMELRSQQLHLQQQEEMNRLLQAGSSRGRIR